MSQPSSYGNGKCAAECLKPEDQLASADQVDPNIDKAAFVASLENSYAEGAGTSVSSLTGPSASAKQHLGWKRETTRRVFANRNLHLANIRFFGFDMDYTLAMYKSPDYEALSFRLCLEHLVNNGYPAEIKKYEYDPGFPIRGLWLDKVYGTLLKVDGFGNILTASLGLRFLRTTEVRQLYSNKFVQFDEKRFYVFNTLFNLPECYLFAILVDYFSHLPEFEPLEDQTGLRSGEMLVSYKSIFQSVRDAIEWLHSSSELHRITAANVKDFVVKDSRIPLLLDRIRANGAKAFLLTNSPYSYTNAIMAYLLNTTDEKGNIVREWMTYFDYVFVDAAKPLFFETGTIMRLVDRQTGKLRIGVHVGQLQSGAVYSGGSCDLLCKLIGATGKDVLYVGDHIYSDILKTKKIRGWRTFLVVPELMHELYVWKQKSNYFKHLQELDRVMGEAFRNLDSSSQVAPEIGPVENQMREISQRMEKEYGEFGSMFRCGPRPTFFASQVIRFADLYAYTFLNLIYYPLSYLFRTPFVMMPHEATVEPERDEMLEQFVHDQNQPTISRARCPSALRQSATEGGRPAEQS